MRLLNAALLIAVGLIVLYVASRGGMDCIAGAWDCLRRTSGAGTGGIFGPGGPGGGGGGGRSQAG